MHISSKTPATGLAKILENTTEAILNYSTDFKVTYANTRAGELLGVDEDALDGGDIRQIISGFDSEKKLLSYLSKPRSGAITLNTRDKWYQVRLVTDGDDRLLFISDITTAKSLENKAQHHDTIISAIPEALIITDADGVITEWNHDSEKLYKWPAKEVLGKVASNVLPSIFDSGSIKEKARQRNWRGEADVACGDGSRIRVLTHISALLDTENVFTGLAVLSRDITDVVARRQLAAIVESSDDAIISKDLNSVITSWNHGAEKIFGYTAREAIGKSILMLLPPELQHEEEHILGKIKRGEKISHHYTERVTKDGRRLNISLTISPVKDDNGNIVGASKIARDVTDQVNSAKALQASEEKLRAMFSQAGVGVALINNEMRLIEVNPKLSEIVTYDRSDLLRSTLIQLTYSEEREKNKAQLQLLIDGKAETATFESRFNRKFGGIVWVRVTAAPIRGADGSVNHLVAIIEDVTDYKMAELGLRESENRFRILAENIPNMAWMANPDGYIFWCNQRWYEYLGASFETIKGWGWQTTLHPDHRQNVHDFLEKAWNAGEPWEITFPLRGRDGTYRWFLTNGYPVRDHEGNIQRWIGTCTDVDALKHGPNDAAPSAN